MTSPAAREVAQGAPAAPVAPVGRVVPAGPTLEPEELALADVVARLRRAMRRAARLSDPANTLSVAQLELLSSLAENPGSRPGQLARLLQLRPNSVTTLVNGLEARQLLARSLSDTDRRAVSLVLTPAGERAVRQWQVTNAAILGRALGQLPPPTRSLVSSALPGLSDLVEAIEAMESTRSLGGR